VELFLLIFCFQAAPLEGAWHRKTIPLLLICLINFTI